VDVTSGAECKTLTLLTLNIRTFAPFTSADYIYILPMVTSVHRHFTCDPL